jgi:hypothetical protein
MLPETYHGPSSPSEFPERALISGSVQLDFLLPERTKGVLPARKAVAVPKITIGENSNFRPVEYEVRLPGELAHIHIET